MRKTILLYLSLMIIIFLIPILFTKNKNDSNTVSSESVGEEILKKIVQDEKNNESHNEKDKQNSDKNTKEENGKALYKYDKYSKIRLIDLITNKSQELDLDEYLYGVVSAEMPANFEKEALKAQAVVARTYTFYNMINNKDKHGDGTICTSPSCCQAWISKEDRLERWSEEERDSNWDKIVEAVNSTKGKVITYNGEIIDAFFHSNSGGKTESPANVWGGTNYPYLASVETAGEEAYSQYQSNLEITKSEFEKKMKEKYSNFSINWNENDCIKILEHTQGNRVKKIKIGNKELSGVEVRTLLGLKSANFEFTQDEGKLYFNVIGYGHGVGMSQTGADSIAKTGGNYVDIIKHFYTGVEVVDY